MIVRHLSPEVDTVLGCGAIMRQGLAGRSKPLGGTLERASGSVCLLLPGMLVCEQSLAQAPTTVGRTTRPSDLDSSHEPKEVFLPSGCTMKK